MSDQLPKQGHDGLSPSGTNGGSSETCQSARNVSHQNSACHSTSPKYIVLLPTLMTGLP